MVPPAGTLTLNKMEIQEYCPTFKEGETLQTVLIASALAAKWKEVRGMPGWGGLGWGVQVRLLSPRERMAAARQSASLLCAAPAIPTPAPRLLAPLDPTVQLHLMVCIISLQPPKDALDTMVLGAVDLNGLDVYTMLDHAPFDPTIKRTESVSAGCRH